jgi:hypothetical protein
MRCMADLIDSLQTSQDFLRRDSLCCARGGDPIRLNRLNQRERTESSHGPMMLIALAMSGLLACAFYIYVLCQWMQDTNGKRTLRPPSDGRSVGVQRTKRPYIVGSRNIAGRHDCSDMSLRLSPRGWNESERVAYQKIASSLSLRKRS